MSTFRPFLATAVLLLNFSQISYTATADHHKPNFVVRFLENQAAKIAKSSAKKTAHDMFNYITSAPGLQDMAMACALTFIIAAAHNLGHATADKLLLNNSNTPGSYDSLHHFNNAQEYTHLPAPDSTHTFKKIGVDLAGPLAGVLTAALSFVQLQKHDGLYITKAAAILAALGNFGRSATTKHDYAHAWQHIKSIFITS